MERIIITLRNQKKAKQVFNDIMDEFHYDRRIKAIILEAPDKDYDCVNKEYFETDKVIV